MALLQIYFTVPQHVANIPPVPEGFNEEPLWTEQGVATIVWEAQDGPGYELALDVLKAFKAVQHIEIEQNDVPVLSWKRDAEEFIDGVRVFPADPEQDDEEEDIISSTMDRFDIWGF